MSAQCGQIGPGSFLCILRAGHRGQHLSLDNREMWGGNPGKPVRWPELPQARPRTLGTASALGLIPGLPITGETCSNCGGINMIVQGRCSKCIECGTTTGCGA